MRERVTYTGPWPENSLLESLDDKARDDLLARGRGRQYQAGEVMVRQGATDTHVVVLIDGYAKVTASGEEGTTTFLALRVGGDLIGELAAMDDNPRIATVTAGGAVAARVLDRAEFHRYLEVHPEASLRLGSSIAMKLRGAVNKLVDFHGRDIPVRVARVLCELALKYGRGTPAGIELSVSLTQPELAGLVSASEPAVHRALATLRRDGVVATSYRRFRILDLSALAHIAGMPGDPHKVMSNP
ncbi:Crp/Fnr family transcriptional regulator [Nocardiopsis sp. NPDC050513]|uniref:Crp/Fnr family transcriptional regulator n=1 Tax=Nocardiopsis sp. NPDC050513 TaxID=3364338 RepID=UPI00378A536D